MSSKHSCRHDSQTLLTKTVLSIVTTLALSSGAYVSSAHALRDLEKEGLKRGFIKQKAMALLMNTDRTASIYTSS